MVGKRSSQAKRGRPLAPGVVIIDEHSRESIRAAIDRLGLSTVAEALEMPVGTVLRLVGGLGVRRATLTVARLKLPEIEKLAG